MGQDLKLFSDIFAYIQILSIPFLFVDSRNAVALAIDCFLSMNVQFNETGIRSQLIFISAATAANVGVREFLMA